MIEKGQQAVLEMKWSDGDTQANAEKELNGNLPDQ